MRRVEDAWILKTRMCATRRRMWKETIALHARPRALAAIALPLKAAAGATTRRQSHSVGLQTGWRMRSSEAARRMVTGRPTDTSRFTTPSRPTPTLATSVRDRKTAGTTLWTSHRLAPTLVLPAGAMTTETATGRPRSALVTTAGPGLPATSSALAPLPSRAPATASAPLTGSAAATAAGRVLPVTSRSPTPQWKPPVQMLMGSATTRCPPRMEVSTKWSSSTLQLAG
mmetsp:Transcript_29139/g.93029  ORF Transcript_29139/g.93029 Transcript_29139/m.93029 type:complete len:228 (-) Transcript_29139:1779-2462(-)